MKILHFIGIGKLPRDPEREAAGGSTRVALELARLQAARGHRVMVATVARARWRAAWQGVSLASVPIRPGLGFHMVGRKLDLSTLLPLFLLTSRYRFNVIHSHEYNYLRYLPADIRITHFHNDPFRFPDGHKVAIWEANECLAAARYSHAHVAVSHFIAERLRLRYASITSRLPKGFEAARRIHVVPNGVDLALFDPQKWSSDRDRLRRSWGVGGDDIVFLYCGAIAPDKGVLELARAFNKLCRVARRVRLVLAGDAALWEDDRSRSGRNEEHTIYQHAVYAGLRVLERRGQLIRLDLVPPNTLPGVYAAADVAVVPSVVQEAFCLSAAEALAMGKPLVACRVGGLVEFAGQENSLLVPPGDDEALFQGLRVLLEDHQRRTHLASVARRSVSCYTWARASRQLEEIYRDLLTRKRSIVCAKPPAFYRL